MSVNHQHNHEEDVATDNAFAAIPRRRRSRRVRQVSARYPVGHRNSGRSSFEIERFFNVEQGGEQEEAGSLFASMQDISNSSFRSITTSTSNDIAAANGSEQEEHRYIGNVGSFSNTSNDEQYIVENTSATTSPPTKLQPVDVKGIFRFPRNTCTQKAAVNPAA